MYYVASHTLCAKVDLNQRKNNMKILKYFLPHISLIASSESIKFYPLYLLLLSG